MTGPYQTEYPIGTSIHKTSLTSVLRVIGHELVTPVGACSEKRAIAAAPPPLPHSFPPFSWGISFAKQRSFVYTPRGLVHYAYVRPKTLKRATAGILKKMSCQFRTSPLLFIVKPHFRLFFSSECCFASCDGVLSPTTSTFCRRKKKEC